MGRRLSFVVLFVILVITLSCQWVGTTERMDLDGWKQRASALSCGILRPGWHIWNLANTVCDGQSWKSAKPRNLDGS